MDCWDEIIEGCERRVGQQVNPQPIVNEKINGYFNDMCGLTQTVINNSSDGLIIEGDTALGKTHTVLQVLKEAGLIEGQDYVVFSTYTTPLELHHYLHQNNGKIIVMDDVMKLFESDVSRGILMAALWSCTGKRTINYHSTSGKLNVPATFEFTGRIIFLTNKLPKEISALKSRCLHYKFELNYQQRMELIQLICEQDGIPFEIFEFIRNHTDESTENLNLRLPVKLHMLYKSNPDDWQRLAKTQIIEDDTLSALKKILEIPGLSSEERVKRFEEATKKSRATYYRHLQRLEKNGLKVS